MTTATAVGGLVAATERSGRPETAGLLKLTGVIRLQLLHEGFRDPEGVRGHLLCETGNNKRPVCQALPQGLNKAHKAWFGLKIIDQLISRHVDICTAPLSSQ